MGYQVLARKWRPGKFSELVGQEHVVRAISNALDNDRLHHAYLFTGTRGVGKTTIARIFSRSLNCDTGVSSNPCGVCPACLDIEKGSYVDLIEIDAASRTKVEDTREILDNVQYRPTRGEYKVYLIDEVHMLSKHSFNALLKTLEEPPPHIKFLLATTDPQKLPITILSRCLQFNLKALTREQIGGQLSHILKAEHIPFDVKALELLARSAHGSMRDALSLTDQAIAQGNGQVMSDIVSEMLGLIDADQIGNLVSTIFAKDKIRVLEISSELALMGTDFKAALAELMSVFHQIALTQFVPEACKLETSQARQIYAWARAISPELVQLYYQIALQGRKDIEWAQDLKIGFEMAIMRMMAFTPEAIKTDISDLQIAAKQVNQEHTVQFADPPQSLLSDVKGELDTSEAGASEADTSKVTPQNEYLQKKNELQGNSLEPEQVESDTTTEPAAVQQVDNSVAAESRDNVSQSLATKPLQQVVEDTGIVDVPDALLQATQPDPIETEPSEQQSSQQERSSQQEQPLHADQSTAELNDPQNKVLAAEMDALIEEADELKPAPVSADNLIPKQAAETFTATALPDTQTQVAQLKTQNTQLQTQNTLLQTQNTQSPPIQAIENGSVNAPGLDDYSDYDSLQQANEQNYSPPDAYNHMAVSGEAFENQPAESATLTATQQVVTTEPKSTGNSANTANLLNLMQTLNQVATEDEKPSGHEDDKAERRHAEQSDKHSGLAQKTETALSPSLDVISGSSNATQVSSFDTLEKEPFQIEPVDSYPHASESEQNEGFEQGTEVNIQPAEKTRNAPGSGGMAIPAAQSSAQQYSDDLYQTNTGAQHNTGSSLADTDKLLNTSVTGESSLQTGSVQTGSSSTNRETTEQLTSVKDPTDTFFSPEKILHQQGDDQPPWNTGQADSHEADIPAAAAVSMPDLPPATEDYFSPEVNLSQDANSSTGIGFQSDVHSSQDAGSSQGTGSSQDAGYANDEQVAAQADYYDQVPPVSPEQQAAEGGEEEWQATDTEMSVDFDIPFAIDGKKVTKASQLDTWSQLIERAGLGGLTKQLALNSNYFNDGEHIKLVVSKTQTHLMSENTIRTIEGSISGAIQQPIKLNASIGEVIDTPAAVQKAINGMRQQHAIKTIQQDSAVADICHSFSGTILQDTIKPR